MEALLRERERESKGGPGHNFKDIISLENLLVSYQEFLRGKRKRKDVAKFSLFLIDNILNLHRDLKNKSYIHGSYFAFKISDPKPRDIHKAKVRDRLVHHALHRILYPYFDKQFIFDSYSCRIKKGTLRAINRFRYFIRKVSQNNTKTVWILKCDIRKFFANIDHLILKNILERYIEDNGTRWLLAQVINIYMNEFDQFIKRKLKIKYYIRYADDFIILSRDIQSLQQLLVPIAGFLKEKLNLELHPNKVSIKTINSGVDYLGWVSFPSHRILRASTKRRVFRGLTQNHTRETYTSYLGLLKHGSMYKVILEVDKLVSKWST